MLPAHRHTANPSGIEQPDGAPQSQVMFVAVQSPKSELGTVTRGTPNATRYLSSCDPRPLRALDTQQEEGGA